MCRIARIRDNCGTRSSAQLAAAERLFAFSAEGLTDETFAYTARGDARRPVATGRGADSRR
jgi:hypothetical protein